MRTPWTTGDIWLRRDFEGKRSDGKGRLHLRLHHDEDVTVYVNGHRVARLRGYTSAYGEISGDTRLATPAPAPN